MTSSCPALSFAPDTSNSTSPTTTADRKSYISLTPPLHTRGNDMNHSRLRTSIRRCNLFLVVNVLLRSNKSMTSTTEAFAASSSSAHSTDERHDRLSPWSKRWTENNLGWHQDNVHETLLDYGHLLVPNFDKACTTTSPQEEATSTGDGVRVLVPLCGKTVDMAFLAHQPNVNMVVGVDGIRKALDVFVSEHDELKLAEVQPPPHAKYEQLQGDSIILLKGDFFELDETATGGKFDSVWDRASLVAIQPNLREDYVQTIGKLLKPGGTMILSTFDRRAGNPEALSAGPPFSIPEKEVRRLYEGQGWVESIKVLQEVDDFAVNPEHKEIFLGRGVTSLYELVFEIKAKAA